MITLGKQFKKVIGTYLKVMGTLGECPGHTGEILPYILKVIGTLDECFL